MAINPVKALLFLAGGTAAAAATAYVTGVFDGMAKNEPAVVAAAPEDSTPPAEGRPQPAADDTKASDKQARPEAGKQVTETVEVLPPRFDVVRVEPNGSIVIAGSAPANSNVEVLAGTSLIGTAEANLDGDFALVLDDPLDPGDYQIVLRATTSDGLAATSVETAVVSVPEAESGQVLALVEEPGKPSKLITVPEAKPVTDDIPDEAGEESPPPAVKNPDQLSDPAEEPAAGARPDEEAASPQPAEAQSPSDDGPMAAAAEPEATAPAEQAAPKAETAASEADAAADTDAEPAQPQVSVEAVEIEGKQVFVAGSATPGASVRVYANEILLGDARVSQGGRFLIEAQRDIPVGDYIVRADVLDGTGAEVLARAAVPFQREAGEKFSAVAPQPATEPAADAGAPEPAFGQTSVASQSEASGSAAPVAAPEEEPAATASETTAPKLEKVDGSVIIRRGDTLWQISRRVYGRGVRYSTIYLANQDQISDPDLIWPGQIFKVPGTTDEGEKADLDALDPRQDG
ncbi:LysM peptidoglycan-binding domain-containing protein [Mesorhizobium xinjiangense]|uniref:LysM peptidoglycan-binding domain-containing protein n=1 Tax=Mesorhizobium xinjiangense TaxID=2678685 RepID=UPI0012EEAB42|nr:LysM peptidoglycan-binding domain-containing protein [Mesorhizobium xinjiangense]